MIVSHSHILTPQVLFTQAVNASWLDPLRSSRLLCTAAPEVPKYTKKSSDDRIAMGPSRPLHARKGYPTAATTPLERHNYAIGPRETTSQHYRVVVELRINSRSNTMTQSLDAGRTGRQFMQQ